MSLRQRMILFFSFALSIIITAFGSVFLRYSISAFRNQSYDYCRQIVESSIGLMDTYLGQLRDVSMMIANDMDVIDAVSYQNSTRNADYKAELYYQRKVADKMKQVDVLGSVETSLIIGSRYRYLYYYGTSPKRDYDFQNQRWLKDAARQTGSAPRFTGYHNTDYLLSPPHENAVSIVTPILNSSQYATRPIGYILFDFQLSTLLSGVRPGSNVSVAIYNNQDQIYFPDEIRLKGKQEKQLSKAMEDRQSSFTLDSASDDSPSYLVVNRTSNVSGWSILGLMPLTEIDSLRSSVVSFASAAVLISIGVVVILSSLVSKSILIPIDRLVESFSQIARGKTDVVFEQSGSREINLLARTAHEMLGHINSLSSDLMRKQRQFSEAQLKILQHQINPHFLNNALQSIKSLAVAGDTKSVSKMATLLGRLLSYSVYEPFGKVPLSEELQHTENYIILQKVRFPNIDYSISCESAIRDVPVPKLIVQPLVENSIEHGLLDNQKGHIGVCAEADEGEIHIIVSDTGAGFSDEKKKKMAARLESEEMEDGSGGIGLLNVHRRIRSIYGKQYGISILSRPGMNTSVVITIPWKGGKEYAESHAGG